MGKKKVVKSKKFFIEKDEVVFSMKLNKGYKRGGFSFPCSSVKITGELADDLKMRAALVRLAKVLTMQFRKNHKKVRGVIISSVDFTLVFQDKKGD